MGLPEGPEGQTVGPGGRTYGWTDGQTYGQTDGRMEFLPILQDFVPCQAAAQKGLFNKFSTILSGFQRLLTFQKRFLDF